MATRNKLWANIDWITFFVFLLLALLGWINIYAAVYDDSHKVFWIFPSATENRCSGSWLLWLSGLQS